MGLAKASSKFKGDLQFRMTGSLSIFSGNAFPDPAPSVLVYTHPCVHTRCLSALVTSQQLYFLWRPQSSASTVSPDP